MRRRYRQRARYDRLTRTGSRPFHERWTDNPTSRGAGSAPHYHPIEHYVTVLKGTWWVGTGDEFAPGKAVPLKVGGFMKHPIDEHHFDGAKDEEVILQITGYGPTKTTYLRPQDGRFGPSLQR